MRRYWEPARAKIDAMTLRERVMIFAAAMFVVIALMETLLLEPLLAKQKVLSGQLTQQQEKMKELQAQTQVLLQAKREDEHSPLRVRLAQLTQESQTQDEYLRGLRDRLVAPDKMADVLQQVLNKNGKLQLVALKTLPAEPLIPQSAHGTAQPAANANNGQKQLFMHGVQITVRGSYLDLLNYLSALEKMPTQMLWKEVSMTVEQHPDAVLTVTLYTLSLDKTWLSV